MLVERALRNELSWKLVGIHLDGRKPSRDAAERVLSALETGDTRAWLAAHLLGCIGHEIGHDALYQIFETSPGMGDCGAAGNAGAALSKIEGCRVDWLIDLMHRAPTRAARHGVAEGLLSCGPTAVDAVFEAAVAGTLHHTMGASLAGVSIAPVRIRKLLTSEDERTTWLALDYLTAMVGRTRASGARARRTRARLRRARPLWLDPVKQILSERKVRMKPAQRAMLQAWTEK